MEEKYFEIEKKILAHLNSELFENTSPRLALWNYRILMYSNEIKKDVKPISKEEFQVAIDENYQISKAYINKIVTSDFSYSRKEILIRFKEQIENLFDLDLSTYLFSHDTDSSNEDEFYLQSNVIKYFDFGSYKNSIKRKKKETIEYYELRPVVKLLVHIRLWKWINKELLNSNQNAADSIGSTNNKYLVWNGNKNVLADIFLQLKELELLATNNKAIARLLRNNFECFKDTEITTIKGYLEKPEKRPQKDSAKLTIVRGFIK